MDELEADPVGEATVLPSGDASTSAGVPSVEAGPTPIPEPEPSAAASLAEIAAGAARRHKEARTLLSFEEFLADVLAHPERHTRHAARYLLDAILHFGAREVPGPGGKVKRWNIFDAPGTGGKGRVQGQERAQAAIVKYVKAFAERGKVDKLLMLHGPNGSAKSTTVECLMKGLESYSLEPEGALFRFHWVFSDAIEKGGLGFADATARRAAPRDSYAHAAPEEVTSRISCALRDNPLFLVPREERARLLRLAYRRRGLDPDAVPAHILEGDLSSEAREILDALLRGYHGDFERAIQHIQVERFHVSRRYRTGAVSIEPQRNVDAASHPMGFDRATAVPVILQGASLVEPSGDLIDANRGVVEYSDFFKRPLETNKYLLTTIEKNTISLPSYTASVDMVFLSTSNEKQLCLFKRDPDFPSFKGRFELIEVPYLLEVSKEQRIYEDHLAAISREKHVAPHTAFVASLWAVLTRLKRPRTKSYTGAAGNLVARLTPIQKAYLYDRGEPPSDLSDQEKRELLAILEKVRGEFDDQEEEFEGLLDAAYEGRRGASPREMQSLLSDAAAYAEFPCLSPLAVLKALRELVKDVSVYDFLRLTPQSGYNDSPRFIDDVEGEWRRRVEEEVQDALDLVPEREFQRLFEDYFAHVKAFTRGEKVPNRSTGALEAAREDLMAEVERAIDLKEKPDAFRRGLVTRIAAWTIDHPGERPDLRALFADVVKGLKADVYKKREKQMEALLRDMLRFGTEDFQALIPSQRKAVVRALARMKARHGYCLACAKETVAYVLRHRPSTRAG